MRYCGRGIITGSNGISLLVSLLLANSQESNEDEVDQEESIAFVLPTKWPVEYATSYRLKDPNGIVVDVPGGLVKKEGWLDLEIEHPMLRSVKCIQRETGARFIVYVNGDIPRYATAPKPIGVSVRLYREGEIEELKQVALLQ